MQGSRSSFPCRFPILHPLQHSRPCRHRHRRKPPPTLAEARRVEEERMAKKTAEKEAAREAAEERMAQKAAEAEAAHACGVSLETERRWELRLPRG